MPRTEIQHPWPDNSLVGGIFLVISNLILAFIVADLAYKWRLDLAAALMVTMIVSILYHSCRAGFGCEERFRDQQIADHIFVYYSLLLVASKLIVRKNFIPEHVRHTFPHLLVHAQFALFSLLFMISTMLNLYNPESALVPLMSFGIPAFLVVGSAIILKEPVFYEKRSGTVGVILFSVSFVFYGLAPHSWYEWAHSLWHLLSMLSVYFIVFAIEPPTRLKPETVVEVDWKTGRNKV